MTCLAATLADHSGHLLDKTRQLLPEVLRVFDGLAIVSTEQTHPELLGELEQRGAVLRTTSPSSAAIGRHRREAVAMAHASGSEKVMYADFDHVLRWAELRRDELTAAVAELANHDLTVIGRSPRSIAAGPRRLRDTESVVNHVYFLMSGRPWDLLMAARGLSRRAAEVIIEHSNEDSIANDLEWPLLCEQYGLSLGYVEADGLLYETNQQYGEGSEDDKDGDPRAWITRMRMAALNAEVMARYLDP